MRKKIRYLFFIFIALFPMLFAACGLGRGKSGKNSAELTAEQTGEWVYVPRYLEPEIPKNSYYSLRQVGDDLYYSYTNWDASRGTSSSGIRRYRAADDSLEELPIVFENGNPNNFDIVEDGSVYAAVYRWNRNGNTEGSSDWRSLEKYDASGAEVYRTDIEEILVRENVQYFVNLIVDGRERVYLVCDNKVLLFDEQGNFSGSVELGSGDAAPHVSSVGLGKDGKVYVRYLERGYTLAEIDFDKKKKGAVYESFPGSNGNTLNWGTEKDFLVHDGTTVYEYDLATKEKEPLFSWSDCDINGTFVTSLGVLSDGKVLVVENDWSDGEGKGNVILLSRVRADEAEQKETLVLGTMTASMSLKEAVVEFNKKSDKYHVTLKEYLSGQNWGREEIADARNRMMVDIVAGNGPDILDLGPFMQMEDMGKEMLEDLSPYLEKSSVISRDSFVENVLESATQDGALLCLPRLFTVQTLVGRVSDVGEGPGFAMDDMIALSDRNPGKQLFEYSGQLNALMVCMNCGQNAFVDREKGACSFDSPEFVRILEFANRFPPVDDGDVSGAMMAQSGEILLMSANLYDFFAVQLYEEIFEGEASIVGYPTIDGSLGYSMQLDNMCAIAANSKHKEGAWAFLEIYVTAENERNMYAFPTLKERMAELVSQMLDVEYMKDEDGNLVLDENGDPQPIGWWQRGVRYPDGWSYTYHPPAREEVDTVLEIIRRARPAARADEKINDIIYEEAASYFDGSKPAEDVADIIQRRVQIYVSENS